MICSVCIQNLYKLNVTPPDVPRSVSHISEHVDRNSQMAFLYPPSPCHLASAMQKESFGLSKLIFQISDLWSSVVGSILEGFHCSLTFLILFVGIFKLDWYSIEV